MLMVLPWIVRFSELAPDAPTALMPLKWLPPMVLPVTLMVARPLVANELITMPEHVEQDELPVAIVLLPIVPVSMMFVPLRRPTVMPFEPVLFVEIDVTPLMV